MHPGILGALLDVAAGVARVVPAVRLETRPRIADFAEVPHATDLILGSEGLKTYLAKHRALAVDSLDGIDFIVKAKATIGATFVGTSADLLTLVAPPEDGRARRGWPTDV